MENKNLPANAKSPTYNEAISFLENMKDCFEKKDYEKLIAALILNERRVDVWGDDLFLALKFCKTEDDKALVRKALDDGSEFPISNELAAMFGIAVCMKIDQYKNSNAPQSVIDEFIGKAEIMSLCLLTAVDGLHPWDKDMNLLKHITYESSLQLM